jgi:hypothetical protein
MAEDQRETVMVVGSLQEERKELQKTRLDWGSE